MPQTIQEAIASMVPEPEPDPWNHVLSAPTSCLSFLSTAAAVMGFGRNAQAQDNDGRDVEEKVLSLQTVSHLDITAGSYKPAFISNL